MTAVETAVFASLLAWREQPASVGFESDDHGTPQPDMTLYYQGLTPFVYLEDLAGSGNIGAESADLHGESAWKITSVSGSARAGVARLQEMVARPEDVVVIEVPSDFVVPANPPVLISTRGGGATGFSNAASLWSVFIDKDQCSGQGYYVFASRWKTIPHYPHIILGHELAHVSHYLQGTTTSEPLATAAENAHRAELGLPLRSVTKYSGGCGEGPRKLPPWLQEWAGRRRRS